MKFSDKSPGEMKFWNEFPEKMKFSDKSLGEMQF